jgi:hypothetical protein
MRKAILIVPYFGRFPSYFNLFLKSCAYNPEFNWLLFTDNQTKYNYPKNITCINISFDEIKSLFKEKLGNDIVMIRPHKLCDYKVSYGFVFADWIKNYDYWGHCDVDVIYGNLNEFIEPLFEQDYDKIFSLGHFSLYRNDPEVNKMFQMPLNGERVDKIIFSSDFGYAFDEWHCPLGGINQIFRNSNLKFFEKNLCANLNSSTSVFQLSDYSTEKQTYITEDFYKQIFSWKEGILTKHYISNWDIKNKTYPYIHFHKRNMKIKFNIQQNEFLIVPDKFIHFPDKGVNVDVIKQCSKKVLINRQFFKVKYINLCYRLKLLLNKLRLI